MPPRAAHGLLLLAALAQPLPGRAQATSSPPVSSPTLPAYGFADVDARLHAQHPAYVGFEVYEGTLFLNVDSLDAGLRLRVLRDVQRGHAPYLETLGARPGRVRFLRGGPVPPWPPPRPPWAGCGA